MALHSPGVDDGFLPPLGASNLRYGVSGLFQFATTNAVLQPVTLTLTYSDADVAGLTETNLAIYRLGTDQRSWLYLGGVVDTNANRVTTAVTNLGTFVLAPPLPDGTIRLVKGGDRLPADGQTVLSLTAYDLRLSTGELATEPWLYTVEASGVEVMEGDVRPALAGLQVPAQAGVLRLTVRASPGGREGRVRVASVAGNAQGEAVIELSDEIAPEAPALVRATAGQSRVSVQWWPSAAPDVAGYRVYYRSGRPGPPWDGTAAVEGSRSPVWANGTNAVLRGLDLGASYHVAVSAVDAVGNESALASAEPATTPAGPPTPPTSVTFRFDAANSAQVTWTRSEDDGFNDRDVAQYEVWREELPGGAWQKLTELPAGSEVYLGSATAVDAAPRGTNRASALPLRTRTGLREAGSPHILTYSL